MNFDRLSVTDLRAYDRNSRPLAKYHPVTASEVASVLSDDELIRECRRRGIQPVDLMQPGAGVRIPVEDEVTW